MPPRLIILTNCTERKRGRSQATHLASIDGPLELKARRWTEWLARRHVERISAIEMYQGDHWTAVLSLIQKAEMAGWDTDLWIASAGYGLIPAHAFLAPYAATFGGSHPDSVGAGSGHTPKIAAKKWWHCLSQLDGPIQGAPRTLKDLARRYPEASWLVLMSPTYLDAISNDLQEARVEMAMAEGLLLVSGKPGPNEVSLIPHWVPALEICRGTLGGSCTSLNARVGGQLVSRYPPGKWNCTRIQPEMNLWMAALPDIEKHSRRAISDREALAYIKNKIKKDPTSTHSGLLRDLRSSGIACEQKRFKGLFKMHKETV